MVGGILTLEHEADRLPAVYVRNTGHSWNGSRPASGTEGQPAVPVGRGDSLPRTRRGDPLLADALAGVGERSSSWRRSWRATGRCPR